MIADGKHIAHMLEQELTEKLSHIPKKHVCFILFGDDPASKKFIAIKSRVAERLGIAVTTLEYPQSISNTDALARVEEAATKDYSGIVVQLPLPPQLDRNVILNAIPVELDIDLLSDTAKHSTKTAPVARAVFEILKFYKLDQDLAHKKILIVGHGKLVGEPVARMFQTKNIPYTIIDEHTPTNEKLDLTQSADIIISGTGSPGIITPDMIKPGVVLIDAGTSEQNNKLVGDIDPGCAEKAALFTPVPGGVGPITIIALFLNLL